MIPFKLDPVFKTNFNPPALCADCGKTIEIRQARIVMTDISETGKARAVKEISMDELARNTVWTILCPECWRKQYHSEPETEHVQ